MNTTKRNGNRWTVNELLSLQREYELLEWTIQQIAVKHQRTETAILFRLKSEGIITSWNDARGFSMESYKASIEDDIVTEDYVCNEETCLDDEECCDNDSEYLGEDEECCDEDDDEDEDEDEDEDDSEYVGGDEHEDDDEDSLYDDVSEVEKLSERVWSLETTVTDIKDMVQHLFNNLVSSDKKKRKPLRKQIAEQH